MFEFRTTEELEPLTEILGQARAVEAFQLALDIDAEGYNVFALGRPGTGKRTLVHQMLDQRAASEATPMDWCYVNSFDEPFKPKAISLPPGSGPELSYDMDQLIEDVRTVLPRAFEADEYSQRRQSIEKETFEEQQRELETINKKAEQSGLQVVWTASGVIFNPTKDGEAMSPEELENVPEEERERFKKATEALQQEIVHIMQQAPKVQRQARKAQKELNRDTARRAFEPLIDELIAKYAELPQVVEHLERVKHDLMENAEQLIELHGAGQVQDGSAQAPVAKRLMESSLLRGYQVNVLVSRDPDSGAPVVFEDNPTYHNMTGRIEYMSEMGTLSTDFSLIKAGTLHRANGGYLILEAHRLLQQPYAWETLKRALRAKEICTESLGAALGLVSTVSLEPEPIPLKVKVVLLGSRLLYHLLHESDPDFAELIKVPADFEMNMDRGDEQCGLYARLLATLAAKEKLRPFTREAVARLIEHSSRMAGDAHKLSVHMRGIVDLLTEADHSAKKNGNGAVEPEDVQSAIDAQLFRTDRMQKQMQEGVERGLILVDTGGGTVGQVNGLAVFPFGDSLFGQPTRITATTRMGEGKVIDIEREVELGGPTHSKGVLILQGYLSSRYARNIPLSLSASLVFEQSYGAISGDSASSAELYALLSSIAEIPLKQSLAVTGSVNQPGQVQPIGAVNEKIEGFFDICAMRGLTGEQGVLIPASNVQHLMLRRDVIDAVEQSRFHVYPVETIDEGMELLTGIRAGELDQDNNYPPDSINGIIVQKLRDSALRKKNFLVVSSAEDDSSAEESET
ncbi:MAG: ATP-binding protein [Candidatus Hydrogenedentes bacterium]|nr:ATP-binding protein [Candidatus Hydrogenedentota bacterium]